MTTQPGETYIGDGLYVSFDGWQFKLRAPRLGGDHEVYLEPEVYAAFQQYAEQAIKDANERRANHARG